ncbi:MAG: rod shape-determining protein MreC [Candidatus Omnitrophica bacterium]|nr:rod shape-determining protein MreC [Candidatus Omnitrophota bacterium]
MLFYHRTFDEYKKKIQEVDTLKARLIGVEEIIKENNRLETLLEFKRKLVYSSITANVIGRDPSKWNSSMIINKGSRDGIAVGQAVVNGSGVVGKIAEVSDNKSKIITLIDPQFSAAIMVQRSRESGVVSGTLKGICRLKFMNENVDIQVGDQVITSKLSSAFPDSLIIGEVVQVDVDAVNSSNVFLVKPVVSFSQLEEVLIILK